MKNQKGGQGWTLAKNSIAVNIVFIIGTIFLTIFLERRGFFSKRFSNLTGWNYADNAPYGNYTAIYPLYREKKDIVMLGNSLVAYASWSELLNRSDVATRGIGGDITAGFIARLDNVVNLKPKIVFIEGGVNDLVKDVPQETIVQNLISIIDTLQKHNIKPVLTTVTLLGEKYKSKNPIKLNKRIKELNKQIFKLTKDKNINLIDINQYVSNDFFCKSEYLVKDGIHFTDKTYKIWKQEVEKVLEQENL